jgi:NTE family protein
MSNGALVLAGGGVAGIAWELGVLRGLQQAEPDVAGSLLAHDTLLVGTSAGSAVASQIAGGTPVSELYDLQLADETAELGVDLDLAEFGRTTAALLDGVASPEEARRRLGAFALAAETVPEATRRAVIAARLPVREWPERRLLLTAVDAESGELRVFDRDSGADLVDAVAASCAVPGVWPTVGIDGRRYMDGGMRSIANADLAAGADRVLVLVPVLEGSALGSVSPAELDALAPAKVLVIYADAASVAAFGPNPLDPAVRPQSATAGAEQGRRVAAEVAAFWN